jgi:hypothetical protein
MAEAGNPRSLSSACNATVFAADRIKQCAELRRSGTAFVHGCVNSALTARARFVSRMSQSRQRCVAQPTESARKTAISRELFIPYANLPTQTLTCMA